MTMAPRQSRPWRFFERWRSFESCDDILPQKWNLRTEISTFNYCQLTHWQKDKITFTRYDVPASQVLELWATGYFLVCIFLQKRDSKQLLQRADGWVIHFLPLSHWKIVEALCQGSLPGQLCLASPGASAPEATCFTLSLGEDGDN